MGRQGNKRQVGAARRRSRGHGLARLDGTRPRATVASKVMKSGEMAGQATARVVCRLHASEARRPGAEKPGRRRQGWKPKWGEPRLARLDAKHYSTTGLIRGRRRPIFQYLISSMRTMSKAGASWIAKMRTINVFSRCPVKPDRQRDAWMCVS